MENNQVENQQKIAELQSAYTKQPKAQKIVNSSQPSSTKIAKSFFWPSYWSGLGVAFVTSIAAGIASSLPGLDNASFFLYLAGVFGVYMWWKNMYLEKFNKAGFIWGVVSLTVLQIILAILLFFVFFAALATAFS